MAVVVEGGKSNLITGYSEGEDTNQDYGKTRWLAQTFTLDDYYHIFRCRFKSWTRVGDRFYHYALRNTDAFGKPVGTDISHTTLSPTGESFYSPGKWRRFDFMDFPGLAAGTYALIARVPDSPVNWGYKLRADSSTPTYALGKAWQSDDSGNTWAEIPNTDLMFEVWGFKPPEDLPPPDVISNWAPIEVSMEDQIGAMEIVVTTDIPVHLYMRWTNVQPVTHAQELIRRGISLPNATRYCFVAWEENEQEEAGDTYIHTFIKPDWQICETRWFYFIGTKIAEESPSASPIFFLHRKGVEMYVISLGKLTESEILHGHVKLKEGANIVITRIDADNALEIATPIPPLNGFGNDWQKYDPSGQLAASINWRFDEVSFAINGVGIDLRLYTESMRTWGLNSPHSLRLKVTRGIEAAGNPYTYWCAVATSPDMHGNLAQQHIGFFFGFNDHIWATNGNGIDRTTTDLLLDTFPPKWLKWVRTAADIKFYVDGVLKATHNTYLPTATNSCLFTNQAVGRYAGPRTCYMTRPDYKEE